MSTGSSENKGDKWITIHPGGSEKGVHVKVDAQGRLTGGNPHLVNAINNKHSSTESFSLPKHDDLGWMGDEFAMPAENDLDWMFEEEKKPKQKLVDEFKQNLGMYVNDFSDHKLTDDEVSSILSKYVDEHPESVQAHRNIFTGDKDVAELTEEAFNEVQNLLKQASFEKEKKTITSPFTFGDKFDFQNNLKNLSVESAVSVLKQAMSKCCSGAESVAVYLAAKLHPNHPSVASYMAKKIDKSYVHPLQSSKNAATRSFATTIGYLYSVVKPKSLGVDKVAFVPAKTKGNCIASYSCYHKGGTPYGSLNISPIDAKAKKVFDYERKKLAADPNYSAGNLESRFAEGWEDFIVCAHEIAHCAYDQRQLKHEWMDVVNDALKSGYSFKDKVSHYSWCKKDYSARINECHSECFAMIAHPDYKPGYLPKAVEDYFRKNFFTEDKLPS